MEGETSGEGLLNRGGFSEESGGLIQGLVMLKRIL